MRKCMSQVCLYGNTENIYLKSALLYSCFASNSISSLHFHKNLSLSFILEIFLYLDSRLEALEEECITSLMSQGFSSRNIVCETYLNLRYQGTDSALMCSAIKTVTPQKDKECSFGDFQQAFIERLVQTMRCHNVSPVVFVDMHVSSRM